MGSGYRRIVVLGFVALLFQISLLSGCGGGGIIDDSGRARAPSVSGFVFKGPVSSGKLSVYKLDDVFLRLALQFDHYRERLNVLAREYLFH